MTCVLAALVVILLGAAYVRGYDLVKSRSPEHLAHFYLVLATFRMLTVATVVAFCVFLAPTHEDAVRQAAIILTIYVAMMVTTLVMRH